MFKGTLASVQPHILLKELGMFDEIQKHWYLLTFISGSHIKYSKGENSYMEVKK
jgi:hypothetical protein